MFFFTASLGSHDRSVGKYDQRWIGGRFATPSPSVGRGAGLPEGRGKERWGRGDSRQSTLPSQHAMRTFAGGLTGQSDL